MLQLNCDDLIEAWHAIDVQVVDPLLQVHGEQKPHESKVMIPVQMTDQNMVDPMKAHLVFHHLYLAPFPTIHKKRAVLDLHTL